MKRAEDWVHKSENADAWNDGLVGLLRHVQADALRHAAMECTRRQSTVKVPAYNTGCQECKVFILAEAERLERGQSSGDILK